MKSTMSSLARRLKDSTFDRRRRRPARRGHRHRRQADHRQGHQGPLDHRQGHQEGVAAALGAEGPASDRPAGSERGNRNRRSEGLDRPRGRLGDHRSLLDGRPDRRLDPVGQLAGLRRRTGGSHRLLRRPGPDRGNGDGGDERGRHRRHVEIRPDDLRRRRQRNRSPRRRNQGTPRLSDDRQRPAGDDHRLLGILRQRSRGRIVHRAARPLRRSTKPAPRSTTTTARRAT